MVVVVLLLLTDDLQLEEELLLVQDLGVGGVELWRRLTLRLLVWRDVLVVLELLHLGLAVLGFLGPLGGPIRSGFGLGVLAGFGRKMELESTHRKPA